MFVRLISLTLGDLPHLFVVTISGVIDKVCDRETPHALGDRI